MFGEALNALILINHPALDDGSAAAKDRPGGDRAADRPAGAERRRDQAHRARLGRGERLLAHRRLCLRDPRAAQLRGDRRGVPVRRRPRAGPHRPEARSGAGRRADPRRHGREGRHAAGHVSPDRRRVHRGPGVRGRRLGDRPDGQARPHDPRMPDVPPQAPPAERGAEVPRRATSPPGRPRRRPSRTSTTTSAPQPAAWKRLARLEARFNATPARPGRRPPATGQ